MPEAALKSHLGLGDLLTQTTTGNTITARPHVSSTSEDAEFDSAYTMQPCEAERECRL